MSFRNFLTRRSTEGYDRKLRHSVNATTCHGGTVHLAEQLTEPSTEPSTELLNKSRSARVSTSGLHADNRQCSSRPRPRGISGHADPTRDTNFDISIRYLARAIGDLTTQPTARHRPRVARPPAVGASRCTDSLQCRGFIHQGASFARSVPLLGAARKRNDQRLRDKGDTHE